MLKQLWVEKYRPKNLSEYICNEDMRATLQSFIDEKNIPNLILSSNAGFGKTSLAKLLVNELDAEELYLNSSLNNSIDDVRDSILTFASTYSLKPLKIIILDEADGMSMQALNSLKGIIEQYSQHTRFIFTTNNLDKLPEPILSRCQVFEMENVDFKEIGKACVRILKEENIKIDKQELVDLIKYYHPDIRQIICSLELCSKDGELKFDSSKISKDYFSDIINLFNSKDIDIKERFYQIRKLIIDNDSKNIDLNYKLLYNNLSVYSNNKDLELMIIIDDYLYKSKTIDDKEINLMACIAKILNTIK